MILDQEDKFTAYAPKTNSRALPTQTNKKNVEGKGNDMANESTYKIVEKKTSNKDRTCHKCGQIGHIY